MNELITITTGGQGSPVVSARELHGFFEIKTEFAKWSKRMFDYGFTEGIDYEQVFVKTDENPTGGRPQIDYALRLDCAKEIAMLQRSAKGKQARQYFIQCEETLKDVASQPLPTLAADPALLQLLNQQTQLLANQQALLEQLRAEVKQIQQTGHRPTRPRPGQQLTVPGLPDRRRPSMPSLRQTISSRVNEYCRLIGATSHETWTYLYKRLYDVYGINPYRLQRGPGESLLDALERYGHLDRLYSLIMAELDYTGE